MRNLFTMEWKIKESKLKSAGIKTNELTCQDLNIPERIDDVRRDIAINFMLTCHKISFLIGQFEVEV